MRPPAVEPWYNISKPSQHCAMLCMYTIVIKVWAEVLGPSHVCVGLLKTTCVGGCACDRHAQPATGAALVTPRADACWCAGCVIAQ
jgi:hypothetical protein